MIAKALTIAGSDSGGGAGIQADLKTFSARGVYGASVITALTAQNTKGVTAIHDVPPKFIGQQMDAVFSDIKIDAVKIGMLSQPQVIETVAGHLGDQNRSPIVLDPVMVAESGDPLLADDAIEALINLLFPLAMLVTPNLHEAARLLNEDMASDRAGMERQALALRQKGANAVLLKGGHFDSDDAADVLVEQDGAVEWFTAPFIDTNNTHGTGCSLSSAITAELAKGYALTDAVRTAKTWLTGAIKRSDELNVGEGAGPVHHFHQFWNQ